MIRLRFDESKIWQNFQITFENGYTVSIGIGSGHYCQNRINEANDEPIKDYSIDCETAIIKPNGKFLPYRAGCSDKEKVQAYVFPNQVAEIIAYAKSLEPNNYGRVASNDL
jgi:hypothetical protein